MEKYLKQYFFTVLLYILLHNNYRSWLHFLKYLSCGLACSSQMAY